MSFYSCTARVRVYCLGMEENNNNPTETTEETMSTTADRLDNVRETYAHAIGEVSTPRTVPFGSITSACASARWSRLSLSTRRTPMDTSRCTSTSFLLLTTDPAARPAD